MPLPADQAEPCPRGHVFLLSFNSVQGQTRSRVSLQLFMMLISPENVLNKHMYIVL